MNPLKAIESWISEHGSAAALRDHLALVKEQVADMKAKKEAAEVRAQRAEAERDDLKVELGDAYKKIESLKQPIASPSFGTRRRDRSIDG